MGPKFVKVFPKDYKRLLETQRIQKEKTQSASAVKEMVNG
jgi:hypothetical protein